jgi:hypothetical protein
VVVVFVDVFTVAIATTTVQSLTWFSLRLSFSPQPLPP